MSQNLEKAKELRKSATISIIVMLIMLAITVWLSFEIVLHLIAGHSVVLFLAIPIWFLLVWIPFIFLYAKELYLEAFELENEEDNYDNDKEDYKEYEDDIGDYSENE